MAYRRTALEKASWTRESSRTGDATTSNRDRTPETLKTSSAPDRCVTAPLCNPGRYVH